MIGGFTAGQVAGFVMLCSIVPGLFILRYVRPERRKPGGDLTIENTGEGCRVVITLQRVAFER
jgi:hypothetical protein